MLLVCAFSILGKVQAQEVATYTLEQCRSLALQQNKKIQAAQYQIDAAKAAQKSAMANAYPTLTGSVTGVHLGSPLAGAFKRMISGNVASGKARASVPLYVRGKINNGNGAAEKAVEIAEVQKNLTTSDVLLKSEQAYSQVVQVNEKIA